MPKIESRRQAYSLLEIILVISLLATISAFVMPNMIRRIEQRRLPDSAHQMRALLTLVRANAMSDGKRFRIRFPAADEIDSEGGVRQPLVEREDEPFAEPGVYNLVTAPWAYDETLLRDVRCAEVRLGRPTLEKLESDLVGEEVDERLEALEDEFEEGFPPLTVEPDGTCEWATFVITDAPPEVADDELEGYGRIEVIIDGLTGLAWLQRPFYDEELDLFRENDWPVVLRKDFLRTEPLTKLDVLEIQETRVR